MILHPFIITNRWTGNRGNGTTAADAYDRHHTVSIENKVDILCSSDPHFRGDGTKHNPEDLFVASLSTCHMLWYLHLCADAGVIVTEYIDKASGILDLDAGKFSSVTLHPEVIVADNSMIGKAIELHKAAHKKCFIANSCNFEVGHEATVIARP